ncbi:MAG TPA: DUF4173 domain-containing protein [Tepidisphaeraceae bacterium]|jgi:hypothetical protein
MTHLLTWRRSYALLLAATLLCVSLADFFFYNHRIGWTAAAFAAVLFLFIALRSNRFTRTAGGKLIALAAIGLVAALIEQPTWLNVPYTILCLGALATINAFGLPRDFPEWTKRWGRLLATGWMRLFSDNSVAIRWLVRHGVSPRIAKSIVAWFIPLILAGVFLAIFAWANPILSEWLSIITTHLARALEQLPNFFNLPRIFFWLAIATFAWTLFRGRGKRFNSSSLSPYSARGAGRGAVPPIATAANPAHVQPSAKPRASARGSHSTSIPASLVIRCLILFNLVFALENTLDVRFLGNKQLLLPTGIEYKEYVRRGAYPLIAAALLAGAFVLITFRPNSQTEQSKWARRLVYTWIAQTIFLTATAAWRLEQYIEMSELTRLRVASVVWFFLVALGLAYVIWRILKHKSNLWLLNTNALTAAIVLYACCFINFDGMIASFNIQHCREGGGPGSSLDIEYFRDLGPTVLPQFEKIRPRLDIGWRIQQAAEVDHDLHQQLAEQQQDWRTWTFRRARAAKALNEILYAQSKLELAQSPTPTAH